MARLVGVDLPREKRLEVALTYIFGVGKTRAKETLAATGLSADLRVRELSEEDLVRLRDYLDGNFKLEGDLRREVAADIRRKVEIGCYEGLRHRRGLPVRGQRTKTNARTVRAPSAPCRQEEGRQEVVLLQTLNITGSGVRTDDLPGRAFNASQVTSGRCVA